jgi:small subunit ribosomal protein S21
MISVPSVRSAGFFEVQPVLPVTRGLARLPLAAYSKICELGGVFRLAEVKPQEGETLENALRRFKRKVQQEDIIKEVKRHSFYLKPGEKLRAKQALARKRNRKKSRREIE